MGRHCLMGTGLFFKNLFFDCVGSSLLCAGFLQLQRAGATLCCGARASHCRGFSCCRGLQARGLQQLWFVGSRAQAQQLWCTGLLAPRHVGSSRTRARTHVPCIGRWILNHCATQGSPWVQDFALEGCKCFGTRQRWWLYNTVNVLNTSALFPLKQLIFCYLNFTSTNYLKKNKKLNRQQGACGPWTVMCQFLL